VFQLCCLRKEGVIKYRGKKDICEEKEEMILETVKCPKCCGEEIIKHGKTLEGKQRYKCQTEECECRTFIREHTHQGRLPEVKQKIIDMSMNGSGIRDIARVLKISPTTVIEELKKKEPELEKVNKKIIEQINKEGREISIEIKQVRLETEADEMWSFVGSKENQRWLWHAIDHESGVVLAYVFGSRKDEVFLELKKLLEPFGITRFYTDAAGVYQRHLTPEEHEIGKKNTQTIERKHLTFRTRIKRLVRKTICFSKTIIMHDLVIGLFINRYEFGVLV
jgi:insertion element IS1 protein InsB